MTPNQESRMLYTIKPNDSLWALANRYDTTIKDIVDANPGINLNMLRIGQGIYIWPGRRYNRPGAPGRPEPPRRPEPPGRPEFPGRPGVPDDRGPVSRRQLDLNNLFRMLWEQHSAWTRMAIMSIVFGLPDAEAATERLLRNPRDFERALRPYYGDRAASEFSRLLRDHLVIAAELVKSAKAGNTKAAADAERRWYENADEIARFLARVNPNWNEREWRTLMRHHLDMVKAEAVQMLNKNYAGSVNEYDEIEAQALEMADEMSRGIAAQFPNRF